MNDPSFEAFKSHIVKLLTEACREGQPAVSFEYIMQRSERFGTRKQVSGKLSRLGAPGVAVKTGNGLWALWPIADKSQRHPTESEAPSVGPEEQPEPPAEAHDCRHDGIEHKIIYSRAATQAALAELEKKLTQPPAMPEIKNSQLKLETLGRLAALMDDSIKTVLLDIRADLAAICDQPLTTEG